jgi:hypothetical protein
LKQDKKGAKKNCAKSNKPKSLLGQLDKLDELNYLSKVVKVGAVEEFNFEFADKDFLRGGQPEQKKI